MRSIAAPKRASKLLLAALLGSAATAQQPEPPAPTAPLAIADAGTGFALLDVELPPEDMAAARALLAGLDAGGRSALDAFIFALPESHRGPFIVILMRQPPARQQAVIALLGQLDGTQADHLGRFLLPAFGIESWPAFATLAALLPPDARFEPLDPNSWCAGWPTGGPEAKACTDAALAFQAIGTPDPQGPGMDIAPPGTAPFQAQLLRAGASAQAMLSPRERARAFLELGHERPDWQVLHICGGAWLGDGWVITAAHCIGNWQGRNAAFFDGRRIRLGSNDIAGHDQAFRARTGHEGAAGDGQIWRIDAVVRHGAYVAASKGHDIALLRLAAPPTGQPAFAIAPVRLPSPRSRPPRIGEMLQVTGWGITGITENSNAAVDREGQPQAFSRLLRVGMLKLARPDACTTNANFRRRNLVAGPGQLCAGSSDTVDTCKGDSGGPLVRLSRDGAMLVGLVSYGPGCGLDGTPAIYTDVHFYRNWIAQAQRVAQAGRVIDFVDGACRHDGAPVPCQAALVQP
jgi:hypothetical protein